LCLAACNKDSSDADVGLVERTTSEARYIGQIDEAVVQMQVDDTVLKFEVPIELRETLKALEEGDQLSITYSGPINSDHEFLLEEVNVQ